MPGSKAVKERIEHLVAEAREVSVTDGYRQKAWLIAAQHALHLVCPSASHPYHVDARRIVADATLPLRRPLVPEMSALLTRLLEEIDGGLLTTVENHAIAVTCDDFLNHGTEYLKDGRKSEAAVIAGIVFEDTIRRMPRLRNPGEPRSIGGAYRGTRKTGRYHRVEGEARPRRRRPANLRSSRPLGADPA